MRPSLRSSLPVTVARASSCGVGATLPPARPASVSTRSSAPSRARRASSSGVRSRGPIGDERWSRIGPGVHPLVEEHRGHAGLRVAGEDRPLDRRRAAVARQQRGVDVDEPEARDRSAPAARSGARTPPPPRRRARARAAGCEELLAHRASRAARAGGRGGAPPATTAGRGHAHVPPGRLVGPGDHQLHLVPGRRPPPRVREPQTPAFRRRQCRTRGVYTVAPRSRG